MNNYIKLTVVQPDPILNEKNVVVDSKVKYFEVYVNEAKIVAFMDSTADGMEYKTKVLVQGDEPLFIKETVDYFLKK